MSAATDPDLVVDGLLRFAKSEVEPIEAAVHDRAEDPAARYLPDGRLHPELVAADRAVRRAAAKAGYYAMCCPADIGGGGLGRLVFFKAWDALYRRYGPREALAYGSIAHWATGPSALWRQARGYLAESILPSVMSAEVLGCFGLSEPDAGSDAWGIRTRATRDGARWTIDGSKQWQTNGPTADYALILAVTDPGLAAARKGGVTCFYVPTATPGFRMESVIRLFGQAGGHEAILGLTGVEVGEDHVLGDVGGGFKIAMYSVNQGRIYNTARCVGMSQWALERAVAYARDRRTFGQPIAEHQAVQLLLADCATEIYAARAAGLRLATENDDDAVEINRKDAAMAKYFATNVAWRVFDRAMQVHGGMGLANEVGLYEGMHLARILRIADGTDEILRVTIAKELTRGDLAL
ncbi:MAG: acyl-CoA dehydrogenase [Dehalococcoidia bacterium]|nr:acyl-CoA dehydrogenase [Dehalococcoidia bacterium]